MVFSTIFSKNGNFIFRIAITGGQKIEVGQNFLFFYFLICLLVLGKIKQTALSQDKTCKKQSRLFSHQFPIVDPRFKEGETHCHTDGTSILVSINIAGIFLEVDIFPTTLNY